MPITPAKVLAICAMSLHTCLRLALFLLILLVCVLRCAQLWKPDTWFSDYSLLTFLCAHDLAPIGEGINVPCPRSNLEKWAPAIQVKSKKLE